MISDIFWWSGGGNIALAGDGGLRQWQISNEVNHLGIAPDSFFAIRCVVFFVFAMLRGRWR